VNWNTRDLLLECLASVEKHRGDLRVEVFVVDNASTDGSADAVETARPDVHLMRNPRNLGYGAANNRALAQARGRIILFLNTDARLTEGALGGLVSFLDAHPEAGCACPQLIHEDGSLQNSFDNVPGLLSELGNKALLRLLWPARYPSKRVVFPGPVAVEAPIGASLAVKREVLDRTGGFDERFFFFLEETDLCLRIRRAGFGCWFLPAVTVVHGKGKTKALRPARAWIEYYRSNYAFFRKHRGAAAALVLRAGKFLRLPVNLALSALGCLLTLGLHGRSRRRLRVSAALLWWHLRLCPPGGGLRD
jgi:GT2 family glycosyltransferase